MTLCNSDIRSLAAGADGALWVGTVEGLNRMFSDTLANGEVVHRIQRIHKPAVFANGYITEMVQDHLHKNIMWAGTLGKGCIASTQMIWRFWLFSKMIQQQCRSAAITLFLCINRRKGCCGSAHIAAG
ncbi:MAG: two-component regulator propeller domain-containing protein [Calditrichia bacterium]